jgi:predicted nucleotidyltransferase
MNPTLGTEFDAKRGAIAALCEKYGVASLDLFGSGTTDEWKPAESDLDFVVVFRPDESRGIADRYLGLAEDLEALFGRPVDLITPASIRNPYFRERVDATRSRIYAE